MTKTKIAFEDIKAGDLIEVTFVDFGVKNVLTGIAFETDSLNQGGLTQTWWKTSEGGMIVTKEENADIYRIDVTA